ncbi:hypothetical protein G3M48_003305 [Beauveria asiatica]|uniref:F-box domain-containing protein n=1 Tax=Beauveria asiatica TaxID=1069075 RepID=A0AAW0S6H4_9HYPO
MSTPRGDDVVTQSQVADSDARDYFNLLPNEIFTLVLDLVEKPEIDSQVLTGLDPTELDLRKLRKAKKDLHDLALVNRRFNALATPLLYKCIDVIYRQSWDNHWTGLEAISQTLKKKTYLRRYIRKFRLILAPRSFNDARLNKKILEVLGSATHLNHLIVSGSFILHRETILAFIKLALANSNSLHHLSVRDTYKNTSPSNIIRALTEYPSKIQELLLGGMVCRDESIPSCISLQNNDTASLRKLQLHDILNNPEATMKSLLKWSKSLKELSLRARNHHSFRIDLQNLLSPYNNTLVVLYLDIRIAPDQIDFSSLTTLEELTLVYWPLIADTRVEFSEDVGRRLLAPRMRRLNWLLVGETKPDLYINSLTTFDEKWLCDLGEYATQHCSRLRIIYAKHNPRLQLDKALLPDGLFIISARELDMPEDIFGRVQLSFKTLGLDFRYSTGISSAFERDSNMSVNFSRTSVRSVNRATRVTTNSQIQRNRLPVAVGNQRATQA